MVETWPIKYSIVLGTLSSHIWPPIAALANCRPMGPVTSLPGLCGFKMAWDTPVWTQLGPVLINIGMGLSQGWWWRVESSALGNYHAVSLYCIAIIGNILSLCDIPWWEALVRSKAATHKYVLTDSYSVVLRLGIFSLALVCVVESPEW